MTDADYAVLHPDGRVTYGRFRPGASAYESIRDEIPEMGTQGMGRLRAWFVDDFAGHPRNRLADDVLAAVGYRHAWAGPVGLSMEEGPDGTPPLLPEVRAVIDEVAARHATGS